MYSDQSKIVQIGGEKNKVYPVACSWVHIHIYLFS